MKTKRILVVLIATLGITGPTAGEENATKTIRLLTVGNSFSRNATRFLPDLAAAGGHQLIHRPIIVGGASLQLHAEKATRHEADPADEAGLYANGRSLKQDLEEQTWDFVTIQQVSIKSHDASTYRPYAQQLADYVRNHARSARLLLHQTWAYRCDDPRFKVASPKPGEPATQEAMYRGLRQAYRLIAEELDAGLIPVGDAFYLADTDPRWGYRAPTQFDPQSIQFPTLPDQTHSLHAGWRWSKQQGDEPRLRMDGHHANTAGEYLGACVFYEVIFDLSVVDNTFVPPGLNTDYASYLRRTAAPCRFECGGRCAGCRMIRMT